MKLARGTQRTFGPADRRRGQRVPLHGLAVVHGDHGAVAGCIENLSLGGALLWLRDTLGRTDALEVELHLTRDVVIIVKAEAVRVVRRPDGPRIAIRFGALSSDDEDAIADAIERSVTAAKARPVMVVDGIEDRRLDLVEALRARHMTPLTPTTPLEAIDLLATPDHHVALCAIAARFGDLDGRDIAREIAAEFPWVRIMYIGADAERVAADIAARWDDLDALA